MDVEAAIALYLDVFGLTGLREGQLAAIRGIVDGGDSVVVRPTGSGKSLIFQIAALLRGGVTLVISPLIALMADQVTKLNALGLPVVVVNSRLSAGDRRAALATLGADGDAPLLVYMAPETMASKDVDPVLRALQAARRIRTIVVDEAHVVCSWGASFRKHYRLPDLRTMFRGVPVACFTATLPMLQRADLERALKLHRPAYYAISLNRPNIYYVATEIDKSQFGGLRSAFSVLLEALRFFLPQSDARRAPPPRWLSALTDAHRGSGIVYCHGRETCEKVAAKLRELGWTRSAHYHGKMPQAERGETFDRWMAGEIDVIVATSALGMGVDKRDVRFVIGFDMTSGVVECAQESGRAGRDGLPATYIALHWPARYVQWKIALTFGQRAGESPAVQSLSRVYDILKGDECLRAGLLHALDDRADAPRAPLCCSVCTRKAPKRPADAEPPPAKHPRIQLADRRMAFNLFKRFAHHAPGSE